MEEGIIKVVQLPIIQEKLLPLKKRWEKKVLEAESMVCTEETLQAVKSSRSEMRKEFEELEALRKQVKKDVMAPYDQFEKVYKDCVTDAFDRADESYSRKVSDTEESIKKRCEDGLREYFAELCAVHHLDWLTYEQAGIKVDMASAKAKAPKKLREQLEAFVAGVSSGVDIINSMDYSAEIMVEFMKHLDTTMAICDVADRHRRIEEQKAAQEASKVEQERESEMVRRVEALSPPTVAEAPEPVVKCTFTVHATKPQLRKLKEFLNMEGIRYE